MAHDPYRYFRVEAQELLESLSRGLLALEKSSGGDLVRGLLRQAHTFKGAARVVKQPQIGDLAHRIEDLLSPHRDGEGPVERETVDRALDLLDEIRRRVESLGAPETTSPTAARTSGEESLPSVRIRIEDMDALVEGLAEASAATALLKRDRDLVDRALSRARNLLEALEIETGNGRRSLSEAEALVSLLDTARRALTDHADRATRELVDLSEAAAELRLISAQALLTDLERAARDAAGALGKEVSYRSTGGDTRIDAHVLSGVRAAMLHLVRNAVAHGIEPRDVRRARGKPDAGIVEVVIERRGHRISVSCLDDGRGLDLTSLRRLAVERGLLPEAAIQTGDDAALLPVLLRGGLSTNAAADGVSGRGVGLDVVRAVVEGLKGEVHFDSRPEGGTEVVIVVPVSLSSLPALAVEVAEQTLLIPLDHVRRTLRLHADRVTPSANGDGTEVENEFVPLVSLRRVLGRPDGEATSRTAVVVEAAGGLAAVGVDRVRGVRNVLVRSLPESAPAEPLVLGAALGSEGAIELVLAPGALVDRARDVERPPARETAALLPILVVDDSLTTRMLEQSILESAGYEVELAVSGEDALLKARDRRYSLFIVDVEMPGMSGFDFIARTRSDPKLKEIPSILVTSRGDAEDKRRGKELGARAYIVKSEFDQRELLRCIRGLVG